MVVAITSHRINKKVTLINSVVRRLSVAVSTHCVDRNFNTRTQRFTQKKINGYLLLLFFSHLNVPLVKIWNWA